MVQDQQLVTGRQLCHDVSSYAIERCTVMGRSGSARSVQLSEAMSDAEEDDIEGKSCFQA